MGGWLVSASLLVWLPDDRSPELEAFWVGQLLNAEEAVLFPIGTEDEGACCARGVVPVPLGVELAGGLEGHGGGAAGLCVACEAAD